VRQPCFLAEDDWKTIPWALDPASKSQQNILTDILVDVPALLAAYDAQYQEPGEKQQWNNDYDLLTRVGTSLFSLYCWRYAWELLNPNAAYETAPPPTIANTRLEPNYLHFHKYEDGANIQLYNAILLFLLNLLDRLSPSTATIATILQTTAIHAAEVSSYDIGTSSTNTSPLLLPHTVLDSVKPAIEIIRAFEYQILNRTENMSSNLFFLFPLGIAGEALQDQKEYWAWIRILLDTSSATTPYAAGRNKWFGNYDEAKLKARRDNIRKEKEMSTVGDAGQETGQDFQYRRAVFLAGVSSTS
jgi:hypothetical protein